jgi:hypothetical protein
MLSLVRLSICTLVAGGLIAPSAGHCAAKMKSRLKGRMIALAPVRDFSRGLDLTWIQPVESMRTVKSEDIARIIPRDLTPTSDGGQIATRILDHSLSSFFNSPAVRNSDLGKTAHRVERTMEGQAAFGGKTQDSIRHVVKFQMRAFQTQALLEYEGLTNAHLCYQIAGSRMDFEVHEKVAINTRLVYNHITQPGDTSDIVSLRWAW